MQEPTPCDLLVTGDLILTLDPNSRTLTSGAIAVSGRTIVDIGPAETLRARWTPSKTIDGKGRIVMPGLVNVHNHTPLMITRGMIEDIGFAPMYTPGIPQGHWLTEDDAYALSSLGMYELLRAGCTTVVDFYRYPSACARAASELGLRAVIAGRVHDAEPGALATGKYDYSRAIGEASLKENAELIERWNGHDEGRIRCDWAPHAPDTCSDVLLREVKKLADAHGGNIHTHLSQLPLEVEAVKARTGLTPPQLLDKLGLLNDRLIAAHCIHMDRADIELCGKSHMTVAHAPIGNGAAASRRSWS
ncbi:MAG: amidohydrolase family protein [Alphaproteobacteria bacterium]|nr:amidohydrolase family protein [Alphaproteobacteria bacterium]